MHIRIKRILFQRIKHFRIDRYNKILKKRRRETQSILICASLYAVLESNNKAALDNILSRC